MYINVYMGKSCSMFFKISSIFKTESHPDFLIFKKFESNILMQEVFLFFARFFASDMKKFLKC